ncbi:hypothetical protein GmRootV213_40380 [Variovorax sp. V213]
MGGQPYHRAWAPVSKRTIPNNNQPVSFASMGAMIRGMRWRFDPLSLAWAVALFLVLVLLATVGARWGWLRSFFGDVLAVVWVYLVFKSFVVARVLPLALAALGVGLAVELGQFLASAWHLHIPNRALRIVLGSTADWWDVLAYVIGFAAVLAIEALRDAVRAARLPASVPRSSMPGR